MKKEQVWMSIDGSNWVLTNATVEEFAAEAGTTTDQVIVREDVSA